MFRLALFLSVIGAIVGVGIWALSQNSILAGTGEVRLVPLGTYETRSFNQSGSEGVAYDAVRQRVFVVNAEANSLDILDITQPVTPRKVAEVSLDDYGSGVNAVAVNGETVAVVVEGSSKQALGQVVFFDLDGNELSSLFVGSLPDHVVFTPDGRFVLVANEGEPNDAYTLDPEGSITIINMQAGAAEVSINDVRTVRFSGLAIADLPPDLRIAKPDAAPANDLEPEYIAVAPGGTTAYVTLQENNAVAILDIPSATLKRIVPLGFKSFQIDPIDASDKDGKINIRTWPVFGMYQPDAIAAFEDEGTLYFAIANEGDSRDYEAFSEEARVGELTLDPAAFPEAEDLQLDRNLGRLKVATTLGDVDNDGDYDALYAFGGRSFSIWDADSDEMVFDSASQFERFLAVLSPDTFNSTNESNKSFDDRSDDKGPEPEGIVIGVVNDKRYAFIGLERIGGVMVYDISNPREPELTTYFNRRNFDGEPESFTADDLGPEGLAFVPADQSPTGEALLIVGNEISGTTSIFAVRAGEE